MIKRLHFLLIPVLVLFMLSCEKRSEVDRFAIGSYLLVLKNDRNFDSNIGLYAKVQRGDDAIVPDAFLGLFDEKARYSILGAAGIFGLVDSNKPSEVLFLFESSTLASWPYRQDNEDFFSARQRGEILLKKLKTSLSEPTLFLQE